MNITLLSDFGSRDGYVATLKASLLRRAPNARLIDVTHEIAPGAIRSACFVLAQVAPWFAQGTVHLAVVDPGVGTSRRALACEIDGQSYVAPDNGLLSRVLDRARHVVAHELTRVELWNEEPSAVFHGRDIFAPVAGHLAAGGRLDAVGDELDPSSLVRLVEPEVQRTADAAVGEIVHVDRFGNLITNLPATPPPSPADRVDAAGRTIAVGRTYSDVPRGELVALAGSSGWLEIACNGGSAASVLGADVGSVVVLRLLGGS